MRAPWPSTATKASSRRGRLRDSVRSGAGYESLIVMSMLRDEHEARLKEIR